MAPSIFVDPPLEDAEPGLTDGRAKIVTRKYSLSSSVSRIGSGEPFSDNERSIL